MAIIAIIEYWAKVILAGYNLSTTESFYRTNKQSIDPKDSIYLLYYISWQILCSKADWYGLLLTSIPLYLWHMSWPVDEL